jgi:hypothetical protein
VGWRERGEVLPVLLINLSEIHVSGKELQSVSHVYLSQVIQPRIGVTIASTLAPCRTATTTDKVVQSMLGFDRVDPAVRYVVILVSIKDPAV